jgi:hypothetical protein
LDKSFTPFSTIFWYKNRLKPATFMIIIFLFKNGQFQCLFNQLFNRIRLKRYIIRGFDKTNASLTREFLDMPRMNPKKKSQPLPLKIKTSCRFRLNYKKKYQPFS